MRLVKFARLLFVAAPLALGMSACDSKDPTDEGSGEAFAIITSVSSTQQATARTFTVTAQLIDRAGTPLPQAIAGSSVKTDVVAIDSTVYVPEIQETRFFLRTIKVDASAPIVLTAGGITDTVEVKVLSGPFPGTVTVVAAAGGTVVQFVSPTPIFDANTAVSITTANPGYLVDVTPTRVRFLLPFGSPPGTVPYAITGAGPADFSLSGTVATPAIPCANNTDNTRATANTTLFSVGAAGAVFGGGNLTADPDDYYRITITEAGNYRFELDWNESGTTVTDMDVILYRSTGALLSAAGATSAKPERASVALTPGDYFVQVNYYDDHGISCPTYKLTAEKI